MNALPPIPDSTSPSSDRGSRWRGFGLFWLLLVVGWILSWVAVLVVSAVAPDMGAGDYGFGFVFLGIAGTLPWLAILIAAIWLGLKGKTQTALGIVLGFLSLIALAVLLVAACFGIIGLSGGLNLH